MNQLKRLSLILAASLLTVGLASATGCKKSEAQLPPPTGEGAKPVPKVPDLSTKPAAETPAASNRTIGTVYPIDRAEVAPNMSAVIEKITVDEGDMVKKGQLLFRMRTSDIALRVAQARAAQRQAQVQVSATKVELDRSQRLLEQKALEQAQYDRVKAQYDAAVVGAEQAKVAVSVAKRMVADGTVKAPIAGVVTHVLKNPGEMATMMPPSVVVIIEDQSTLELRFRLPERSLATMKVGDGIEVTFEAIGVKRSAAISRISPSVDAATRTVEVIANLDNKDGQLKSGMLASVELQSEIDQRRAAEALTEVPAKAQADSTTEAKGATPAATDGPAKPTPAAAPALKSAAPTAGKTTEP